MIGTRLGPYEITAKLGEGGMGDVYRAHDTKLKRDVAIKVLPQGFTEDKERLARFEREAQLLAQLHHPNIASIFGIEESDGAKALVMELVEGPTLADRLESGALPFNETLSVSLQIAHALEEAHEKGIVHRDLKPQNIKASIEGKVKVLDFGLAKAMDPADGSAASAADLARSPTLMQSPTLTAVHGTQLGVILGTAAYMAPEQAKELPIDKRADIWAFGVVLFEMLSGRSLFAGDTVTDTLAARPIFDPRGFLLWRRDGSLVARRFDPASGSFAGESFVVAQQVGSDPDKTALDLFAVAGGVVAVLPPNSSRRELRWFDRAGAPAELVGPDDHYYDPAFSFDRQRVAVARSSTGNYFEADLWIYDSTGADRPTRLTFDGNASTPVWSSDGETVYYASDAGDRNLILAKRADGSGQEEILVEAPVAAWVDDASRREPLLLLEGTTDGGAYKLWLASLAGERSLRPFQHASPGSQTHGVFSPDGRLVAYTSDESGVSQIYVQAVDGSPGRWQVSRDGGDLATWRADGKELYFVGFDRVLRAVPIKSLAPFAVGNEEPLFAVRLPPLAITSQHSYYLPSADGRRFLVNQAAGAASDAGIQVTLGWAPPEFDEARR